MTEQKPSNKSGWWWVPSLYFAEGIPYVIVMIVSVIMYKRLGISNTDIALYTSWLYLPWAIKPLWSPIVDMLKTKRLWIITMQLFVGGGLAGVALTIPVDGFFQYTLAFFWLLAFSSATHDIAADGFYMLGLSQYDQSWFVGIRSTFYRMAMITGQGLLVIVAGLIESNSGLEPIELSVQVSPDVTKTEIMHPKIVTFENLAEEQGIAVYPETLEMSTDRVSKSMADQWLEIAKTWNTEHNFYEAEKAATDNVNVSEEDAPSWFSSTFVLPLENFLRTTFGPEVEDLSAIEGAGNIQLVYIRLNQKPLEPTVVHFGRDAGDKSISLVEGSRFVFTEENWNIPAVAVVQLDPKLHFPSEAGFSATSGNIHLAWMVTFGILAGLFVVFFVYHKFALPHPSSDVPRKLDDGEGVFSQFVKTFVLFFKKKHIWYALGFLLLYRFAEAQLVKMASPFLLDSQEAGGLALSTGQVGIVYGTVGIFALTVGGILGGVAAAKKGLKYWVWWMALAINLPDAVYVYLSYAQPDSFIMVNIAVAVEQFGYGFGFTAYMLYMIYISEGEFKTAHFAITTAFMAFGMMIPGMWSGWLQELIGYQHFFVWVCLATIPAFIIVKLTPIDPEFGKKTEENGNEAAAES